MLKIKQISIKNFRSLRNLVLDTADINVFSGLNDVGKSNILKALNLFFNGETDPGCKLDFETDYCVNAPVVKKKAKVIEIALKIEVPEPFKDRGVVTWKKTWQRTGFTTDTKDKAFRPKSKAGKLFQRIKYRYVPAVKSENYFKSLLKDLYESLASDVDSDLSKKTADYSETIKRFTGKISSTVRDSFGVKSALEYPKDQSTVFSELEFVTDIENGKRVLLAHRGDGVKSIHIPSILKFIAEKDNEALGKNSVSYSTFWGYEEPENGLELRRCYELAQSFEKISSQIQIFLTSHSPAFYSLASNLRAKVGWFVKDESGFTYLKEVEDVSERLGYMPLIEPYVSKKMKEYEEAASLKTDSACRDCDTIFVEGVTDKHYLEHAIKLFSQSLKERLENKSLRIFASKTDGGTSNLVNYAHAWSLCKFRDKKLFVLLDLDPAGRNAAKEIRELYLPSVKTCLMPTNSGMVYIYERIVNQECFSFSIENYFPEDFWEYLKSKGLLESRNICELQTCFSKKMGSTLSLDEAINGEIQSKYQVVVRNVPDTYKKMQIKKEVDAYNGDRIALYKDFKLVISKIEQYFDT